MVRSRPKYGYIWFPSCLVAAAFIYFFLPEVKGRTLEEIDEMVYFTPETLLLNSADDLPQFEQRLPARKFASYKCVGPAVLEARLKESGSLTENAGARVSDVSDKVTTDVVENKV